MNENYTSDKTMKTSLQPCVNVQNTNHTGQNKRGLYIYYTTMSLQNSFSISCHRFSKFSGLSWRDEHHSSKTHWCFRWCGGERCLVCRSKISHRCLIRLRSGDCEAIPYIWFTFPYTLHLSRTPRDLCRSICIHYNSSLIYSDFYFNWLLIRMYMCLVCRCKI